MTCGWIQQIHGEGVWGWKTFFVVEKAKEATHGTKSASEQGAVLYQLGFLPS